MVINNAVISVWKAKEIVIFYMAADQKNQWGKLFLQDWMCKDNKALKAIQTEEPPSKYIQPLRTEAIIRLWIKYGKHFVERPTEQDK